MRIKLLLITIVAFLSSCMSKPIKEYIIANQDNTNAKYIKIGKIETGNSLQAFKLTVDSVDYIVVGGNGSGTAIIKHGK